jgi:hypothetical protein
MQSFPRAVPKNEVKPRRKSRLDTFLENADLLVRIPAKWKGQFGPSGGVGSEQVDGLGAKRRWRWFRQQPGRRSGLGPASCCAWMVLSE